MDLLTIRHEDFTMFVECSKFEGIWNKAKGNVGEENLLSTYTWSDGVEAVERNGEPIVKGEKAPAVFFDNAEYPVWVDFNKEVTHAQFGSMLQSDNERFTFRKSTLAGFINYGNDIGKSELNLIYKIGKETKRFTLGYEVLSTKLNYHEHWRKIIEDIEQEYRMLSLDYMKRTFHGFTPDTTGETPELIWWSVFAGEQQKFIKACRNIIERPRHRLHGYEVYLRADKLKRVPANIENELAEHRREPAHLYRVEEQIQSNDTQENRFLKYALGQITEKYESLKKHIEAIKNVSPVMKREMDETVDTLKHLRRNPFFRTVGRFKGLNQESLVLQRATGYSQVYTTWNLLRRAYSLNDGIYRLQSKDIATLYEIWCFLKVKNIVSDLLGEKAIAQYKGKKMTPQFIRDLNWGTHSEVIFLRTEDNVELASVMYNAPVKEDDSKVSSAIKGTKTFTTQQRPDIVLRLTKRQKGIQYTFLFDAKYRISDSHPDDMDIPPSDAIDQMHRYRDAIYYIEPANQKPKREVIGGYVLFPGNYTREEFEKSHYYESIKAIGIGAFPLKPSDGIIVDPNNSEQALREQIAEWLKRSRMKTYLYKNVAPQHGLEYQDPDDVLLVNFAKKDKLAKMKELGLCYLRTGEDAGAIVLEPRALNAKYVMLHNGTSGTLYKLKGGGPKFMSKEALQKKGFENLGHDYYLVYSFDTSKSQDYAKIPALARRNSTARPWFASWEELMH